MKPQLQALILADRVYQEGPTGKLIIAGTFNRITALQFPTVHQPAWVYVALRDLVRKTDLALVYRDEAEDSPFWKIDMKGVSAPDNLTTREIGVQIPPIAMPKPGKYCIELHAEDELLGILSIEATRGEPQPEQGGREMTGIQDVKTVPEIAEVEAKIFVHPIELYAIRDPRGGFWSCAPQLPGVVSQGETADEALASVREALMQAVQSYRDDGEEIPWAPRIPPEEYARAKDEDKGSAWAIVDMR